MDRLKIREIRLSEIGMPLKSAFETSFGVTTTRRVLLVHVVDEDGNTGVGECTAMDHPFYNHETVDSVESMILRFICPMLRSADLSRAEEVERALNRIQGNRMAIGAVETALWDLESKRLGVPLWRHLGGTLSEIDCGVSIGLQASTGILVEKVRTELNSGYQRIKIKIKPGHDLELLEAVRAEFPDITLSVDANAAYSLAEHTELLRELDRFGLLMIEQPLPGGAILDHSKLQSMLETPLCLDESITSLADAKQAVEMDACRIINIKLCRVGGHSAARDIQEFAASKGVPVWCGGMLETGVGRAHNIAMSALTGFTLPGDVSASSRYWERDITDPAVEVSPRGTITVPDGPGIGFALDEELISSLEVRSETFAF